MFLATFILVFRETPIIPHAWMLYAQPLVTLVVIFGLSMVGNAGWLIATLGGTLAFFVATMVCHRELFDRRPASRHLTEFYLWMSFGGVLGGVFAALVAPRIFNAIWEYPLLLVLAMACRPAFTLRIGQKEARDLVVIGVLAVGAMLLVDALHGRGVLDLGDSNILRTLMLIGFGSLALLQRGKTTQQFFYMAIATLTLALLACDEQRRCRAQFLRHASRGRQRRRLDPLPAARHDHSRRRAARVEGRRADRSPSARHLLPPAEPDEPRRRHRPRQPQERHIQRRCRGSRCGRHGVQRARWRGLAVLRRPSSRIASDPNRFRFLSVCRPTPTSSSATRDSLWQRSRTPASTTS